MHLCDCLVWLKGRGPPYSLRVKDGELRGALKSLETPPTSQASTGEVRATAIPHIHLVCEIGW